MAVTLAEGRTAIGMLTVDLGGQNAKLDLIQTGHGAAFWPLSGQRHAGFGGFPRRGFWASMTWI